ncbi:EAL domain-containing protein [Tissierella sp. Yu-01]|uniref:EAL domain-containing protein n=1 Tax=Tissierella sp. Yu-01 TaxID=3035694 RepID=UPI00240D8B14|nr:EAL domain-containing protein [Tissierella sp. Yu-01]WFA08823.1 EAL domain-containing protein [Tissierella sp. Yu-01]
MKEDFIERKYINNRFLFFSYLTSIIIAVLVHLTNGTTNVYSNLMYIPIAVISSTNGVNKGVVHAGFSALLIGPFMPLNIELGLSQTPINWVIRMIIYLLIAAIIGFFSDYSRKNKEHIYNLLTHDILTDLRNLESLKRNMVDIYKKRTIIALSVKNYEESLSLFGYDFTNKSVLIIASKLKEILNVYDNVEIIKNNGMEFILVITHHNGYINTKEILKSLEDLNRSTIKVNDIPIYIETLIGMTELEEGIAVLEGVRQALMALRYAIVNNLKIYSYDSMLDNHYKNISDIAAKFKSSLASNNIKVAYQNIYSSSSEDITGVELLARWKDDNGFLISPASFIPVIENTELINELTKFMIDKAIDFILTYKDAIVSINFSPNSFNNENVYYLVDKIKENELDSSKIKVEITEQILLNKENAIKYIRILKDHGIIIAMDDFGSGYSSYEQIGEVPIDIIKIDKSIISKICESKLSRSIAESIVYFCRNNNLETIAEGVETEEVAKTCKEIGIDYLQGYYYHKPTIIE